MKKILFLMLVSAITLTATGCKATLTPQEDGSISIESEGEEVEALKDRLEDFMEQEQEEEKDAELVDREIDSDRNEDRENPRESEEEDEDEDEQEQEEEPQEQDYDGPNFITMTSPENNSKWSTTPIAFTGKVSPNTEKIVVTAEGGSSTAGHYKDVYELALFEKGDTTFKYQAKIGWDNLLPGTNEYKFKAYYDDGKSDTANITIDYQPLSLAPVSEVEFDGCKKSFHDYSSYSWYDELIEAGDDLGIDLRAEKGEGCFSANWKALIFIVESDEYCGTGSVYRFYTDTFSLNRAVVHNKLDSCSEDFVEFGKRDGQIIPVIAWIGDAGCIVEYHYDYNFYKNTLDLSKSALQCFDGPNGTLGEKEWTYY